MTERTFIVEREEQCFYLQKHVGRQPLPFQAVIGPVVKQRTNTQNARLWLLHTEAGKVTGYSVEEMHEFALCRHFGCTEVERKDLFTGEITMKRIPNKRSSTRNTKEFAEFMEATEAWYGADFGVWLGQDG